MVVKYKLLEHPFYRAWENGQLSINALSSYGYSYLEFISRIPVYWERVIKSFNINANWVVEEEKTHIELWKKWIGKLEKVENYPSLNELIYKFDNYSPSELAGAIHAFEIQQPEVAKFKKDCLIKFYGFKDEDLEYFDEHLKEEKHIKVGELIYQNYANKDEFIFGFEDGSKVVYESLDKFL